MIYTAFECQLTEMLCREARKAGFDDVWIPMTYRDVVRRKRGGLPEVVTVVSCAMPGYIFVPHAQWWDFKKWAPRKYFVQQMTMQAGRSGTSKQDALANLVPCKCTLQELQRMDEACKAWHSDRMQVLAKPIPSIQGKPQQPPPPTVAVGQDVKVQGAPLFDGHTGTVQRIKADGRVRVRLNGASILSSAYVDFLPQYVVASTN